MNFDDLWIGDLVWIESLQRNAKWEGIEEEGVARIQFFGYVRRVPLSDISEAHEVPEPTKIILPDPPNPKPYVPDSGVNVIDLHIEKLNPRITHERAEIILEFQIKACSIFIQKSIDRKRPHVTIIHGRGEGVLKLEVEHLLENFPEFSYALPANKDGASEVWFQYF